MPTTDDIKAAMTARTPKPTVRSKDLLSTGSTLLNLACTGRAAGGFCKGRYYFFVGDSSSGKTWLCLTCFAEASINPHFDGYRFIYDAPEGGAMMDVAHFFGKRALARIEPPAKNKAGDAVHSTTVEEFYYNLDDALKHAKPCIYVLDSMDAIVPDDDNKKFVKQKATARKKTKHLEDGEGKAPEDAAGSYGTAKAKLNSINLRRVIPILQKTGSILIIISQTRDNIAQFSFEKKTRGGGHALRFFATIEMWSSVKKKLKKLVNKKQRGIGIVSQVQIKKNRVTGRDRRVFIPIYFTAGIDDVGGMIDYLVEERHWKKGEGGIRAPEFDFTGTREALVRLIQENGDEKLLQATVAGVWAEIESALTVVRKNKYEE